MLDKASRSAKSRHLPNNILIPYHIIAGYYEDRAISVTWHSGDGRIYVSLSDDGLSNSTFTSFPIVADENDTWYHIAVVADLDGNSLTKDDLYIYVTASDANALGTPAVFGLDLSSIHNYSGPDGLAKLAVGSNADNFSVNQYQRTDDYSNDGSIDEMAFVIIEL